MTLRLEYDPVWRPAESGIIVDNLHAHHAIRVRGHDVHECVL